MEEKFNPDKELVDFANWFSNNYKLLSACQFGIPSVYISDNAKYQIDYFQEIKHPHNTTVGMIAHSTGTIRLSKSRLMNENITPDYVFWLILWLVVYLQIKNLQQADDIIVEYYLANTKRSTENIISGYKDMVTYSPTDESKVRLEKMQETFKKHYTKDRAHN